MEIDATKLEAFVGQAVADWGAAASAVMVHVGDKLGLYRAMSGSGPMTAAELAERTGTAERYVRDWLDNQAAGGYLSYDAPSRRYTLHPEQALCLAVEDSPTFLTGGYDIVAAAWATVPRLLDAFRTGAGIAWDDYDPALFQGVSRITGPQLTARLTTEWIPALDGVQDKLARGARVADVGCGQGAAAILIAERHPDAVVHGFDFHEPSIATARKAAAEAGVSDRVSFEVATATEIPLGDYDLICFLDCLHDMGDPVGAAARAKEALASDGTILVVEPNAGDRPEDNHNPLGRALYGLSAVFCTAVSLSQDVGLALGAQAGEARLRDVLHAAGLRRVRRVAETPFNQVIEARP